VPCQYPLHGPPRSETPVLELHAGDGSDPADVTSKSDLITETAACQQRHAQRGGICREMTSKLCLGDLADVCHPEIITPR